MSKICEVADNIYLMENLIPGLEITFSTYLMPVGESVLIEPGPSAVLPQIMDGIKELGMKDPGYIIPTHIHMDHAGASGGLVQHFPRAKVLVHPQALKHLLDPSRLVESTKMAFGNDFEKLWGSILPVPKSNVKVPANGEVLDIGDRRLRIVYSPGHAPSHISLLDEKTASLFCGEALGVVRQGKYSTVLPSVAPPGFDMDLYLDTMSELKSLKPKLLLYSHNGIGNRPQELISESVVMTRILASIILKALKQGETQDQIVGRLRAYASARHGLPDWDRALTVQGYTMYLRKRGLV
ncbi:MAG: MBL fold metallo-hydrolase [Chloroflexi bacterium]|nr:MBL fold metallo-hydrolase [Chloroflexota bacterium]